jgi:hypothetical protein
MGRAAYYRRFTSRATVVGSRVPSFYGKFRPVLSGSGALRRSSWQSHGPPYEIRSARVQKLYLAATTIAGSSCFTVSAKGTSPSGVYLKNYTPPETWNASRRTERCGSESGLSRYVYLYQSHIGAAADRKNNLLLSGDDVLSSRCWQNLHDLILNGIDWSVIA